MSTKKKRVTAVPVSAIFRRRIIEKRIVGRTVTKKIISGKRIVRRTIIANKGMEGPTVKKANNKMLEILAELLSSWKEGAHI
jgi:hypothetical protein